MTDRERRMVGIGGVVVLLYGGYVLGWKPLAESRLEVRAAREAAELELRQARAAVARADAVARRLEEVDRKLNALKSGLLPGDSPNIASAELGKLVSRLAAQAKVDLKGKTDKDPNPLGQLTEIRSEIKLVVTIQQLLDLLYAIENHQKELRIPSISIRPRNSRKPDGQLDVRMTIAGYIATPEVEGGGP